MLLATSAILGLLGMLLLGRSLIRLRRGRLVACGGNLVAGVLLLAGGGLAALLSSTLYTYARLTAEQPVAELSFRALGPQRYLAVIEYADGSPPAEFELAGDEWQADARVIVWRPPATLLGMEPMYRLERLSGRYASLAQERDSRRSVHPLGADYDWPDLWGAARRFPAWFPGVDTRYGSAAYLPMVDGGRYTLTMSRSGLIARPANETARRRVERWE